jgi:hypothetical protein
MVKMLSYGFWISLLLVTIVQRAGAADPPTPEQFDGSLRECVIREKIALQPATVESISRLYAGENSRQIFKNSGEFLSLLPEDQRIEGYRLYADCIMKIAPQVTSISPATRVPTTVTYRVCSGEYERACPTHDGYLYCYSNVEDWAKSRCTSYKVQRLNTYGGNKCGYSLDAIICTDPK